MLVKWLWDIEPSKLNPRYCNDCEVFAKKHPGGAEVELAMLFIDIRGSTALAERLGTKEFTRLIDRFYTEISRVLIKSDALIEKLIGDEVAALFVPGYAGADYTARAIDAAKNALKVTGYFDRHGPWIRVGIGVHKGAAFVGSVGSSQGMIEIIALGDAVNIAARLCQAAKAGEIIVSDDACKAAGITCHNDSKRRLALKGRREEVDVCIQ
jgi:adenylate cyclase